MNYVPDGYTAKEVVGAVDQLRMTEGWKILCELLREDMAVIERKIFDEEVTSLEQVDRLKDQRTAAKNLIDLPSDIISTLLSEIEIPNDDPFHTVATLAEENERLQSAP